LRKDKRFPVSKQCLKYSDNGVPVMVCINRSEEKGSDVNLASHLLTDGFKRRYEIPIVITRDSDLSETYRLLRTELGCGLAVVTPADRQCNKLAEWGTEFYSIHDFDLSKYQLPLAITDGRGKITKPAAWA
jgi:hypothetical protein